MAFNEIKKDLIQADADIRSYLENTDEYYKLRLFKLLSKFITKSLQLVIVGLFAIFTLLFLSFAASLALNVYLDSMYLGFVIIGLFYLVTGVLAYIFKNRINRPVIRKLSTCYYDEI
jgi:hypothetical protein|tara:strand:- start:34539 stop:34889 length:351 start_codon:yes stop_codon:yes gene_type:complete